jgi:hypothetical protein
MHPSTSVVLVHGRLQRLAIFIHSSSVSNLRNTLLAVKRLGELLRAFFSARNTRESHVPTASWEWYISQNTTTPGR